jgi:hypothetical protein
MLLLTFLPTLHDLNSVLPWSQGPPFHAAWVTLTCWPSSVSVPSRATCRGPGLESSSGPPGEAWEGPGLHHGFMTLVCLLVKASMNRGGKSSVGSVSRAERARTLFPSRLCPASCRRVGGALLLILKDLQWEPPGKHPGRCLLQAKAKKSLTYHQRTHLSTRAIAVQWWKRTQLWLLHSLLAFGMHQDFLY